MAPVSRLLLVALAFLLVVRTAAADSVNATRVSLPKGPGSIEGLASADFAPSLASGSSSYGIPIAVPPASAGFGPALSLAYDSGAGLTEVGIGWRVAGAAKIRRRVEDGLPRFDSTDTFEVVGAGIPCELLEVSPGVLRPRYEDGSFIRVTRDDDGRHWEVRTKSGVTYELGGDGYEEAEGTKTAAYLLRQQMDRHGHRVTYSWDTSEGHALLTHVVWNDFDEAARNEVLFDYETRPDVHRGFATGILEAVTRRLAVVTVQHGGKLVRRLDLAYGKGTHPALSTVTLVGSDGKTSLPAARFAYTEAKLSAGQLVTMTNTPGRSPASPDTALADLDGDGLPDFLVAQAGQYRSYINHDGTRWLAADDWPAGASPSVSLGSVGVQLADLDADGAPDLVVKSGADSLRYFPRPARTRFDAPVTMATVPTFSFEDPDVRLADMDGDRRTDAIVTTSAGIAIGYNESGTDFTEPALVGQVDAAQPLRFSDGHTELCDVNGDRVQDFCYLRSGGLTYWLGRGRGRFESGVEATGVPAFDVSAPYRLDDLNGDGWVDLVRVDVNRVSYALATAEGAFGAVQTIDDTPTKNPTTSVQFADMNGSGTVDIVWIDVTGTDTTSWKYLELFPDGRAGLLHRIDNGLGKVQTIDYEPASLHAARARDAKKPWTTRLNVAMPIIRRVTVDSSLGDPARVVEYTYRDGTYDASERTFAAFGGGTENDLGDDSTPTLVTTSTFDTGLVTRELRGAALTRELTTEAGSVFTRTTTTYDTKQLDQAADGRSVEYGYPTSELVEHVEGHPDAAQQTLTEFVEDGYGNVTEERHWGLIAGSDYLTGHDEAIVHRSFINDADDWLLGVLATEELTDATGDRVSMTRKYYDGDAFVGLPLAQATRGDLSREEAWLGPAREAFELVAGTKYNADGQPVETKDALGGGHVFEWASDHTAIRAEHVKLEHGKELVETADVDGAFGTLLTAREYNGQETRYAYDVFGRLTAVIRPGDSDDSPTTTYAYGAQAPLSRVITDARVVAGQPAMEHSETLFDGLGRSRGTLTQDGARWVLAGVSLFDARGKSRRTLLPRWVDANAHEAPPILEDAPGGTDSIQDAAGRELQTRSPSGIVSRTEYWPFESRHWDGGQSDAGATYEHTPTVQRQDGVGRTISHTQTLSGAELSARYTYDAAGHLLTRSDPEGARASYAYDGRGRRTKVVDPDLGEHELVYDATSNLVAHTYPDGKTTRFTFDLAGRSLTEDHDGDGTPEVTRTWDAYPDDVTDVLARGKLVRVTGPSGETRHEYDDRGRTRKTTLVIDGKTYAVGSEFDDQERESRHVYPDGSSIELHRNARGQLAAYGSALSIDYGGDGFETQRHFNTGVKITSGYDDDRRRTDLLVEAPDGARLESLHWTYDSASNLTAVEDRHTGERSESYDYDNLYRLTGVKAAWGHESWTFSPSGSLLARASSVKGQAIGTVAYGARPHAPTSVDDRKIVYDARGRMTSDGERTNTWNDADELVSVAKSDGSSEENTYDGDGTRRIRVEHTASGTDSTTHFIDAWSDVKDGQLVRYIVHGGQRVVRLASDDSARSAVTAQPRAATVRGELFVMWVGLALLVVLAKLRRFRGALAVMAATAGVALGVTACNGEHGLHTVAAASPGDGGSTGASVHGAVEQLTDADTLLTTDLLGSVLGEATASGKPTGHFAAYPFGATRFDTSTETQKYAGTPRDGSVALDAMGARYYAPDLGLWTSGDPLAVTGPEHLVTSDFAAANPYAYAKDSPLLAADHDGHFWNIAAGAFVGALVGGALEAGRQYVEHGKVEDWGRVGAAAVGGGVSGAITAANPVVALGSMMGMGAVSGAAGGVATRLVESHGRDAGTFKEAAFDAGMGAATAGILHGGAKLVRALATEAPGAARAVASRVASAIEGGGREGLGLRFSQTTASSAFHADGTFAGKTIGGLAAELRAGEITAGDVPLKYVTIGGNNLIVNTRSSLSLMRAGIPQSEWTLTNSTATDAASIEQRLLRNGLGSEGTTTLRITGLGKNASDLK
ncbi:MAG TPA: toxin TcdB middle/N-terminal domain-containing protein [Polyangiaceae bacterium]|nr:toxin TcdB middle/N-terminal domain-containing protein [Polyangiaceae bacterium]